MPIWGTGGNGACVTHRRSWRPDTRTRMKRSTPSPRAACAPPCPTAKSEAKSDLVASRKRHPLLGKRGRQAGQRRLDFGAGANGGYELPPLALLAPLDPSAAGPALGRDALEKNARLLETVLDDFGVRGEIIKVHPGPVVTRYELEPAPGTKTSRVIGLADDIARSMSSISVRVAVVPGSSAIGIELPNAHRETVFLRELSGLARLRARQRQPAADPGQGH